MTTERMTRKASRIIAGKIVKFCRGYFEPWQQEEIPPVGDVAETLYTRREYVASVLWAWLMYAQRRNDWSNADIISELYIQVNNPLYAVWEYDAQREGLK